MTTFRTKTGHVRVSADELVIERSGVRGRIAQSLHGESKSRALLVYGFIGAALLYNGWASYREGGLPLALINWAFAAWMGLFLARARHFTLTPTIPRGPTHRVEAVRGIPGLTRDRLIVHFVEEGRPVRRYILMPGLLQRGSGELDGALERLREHGWPV